MMSAIVAVMAVLPAVAQEFRLLGLQEAQVRGAVFEVVANPGNCNVVFHPAIGGSGASTEVEVNCNPFVNAQNVVTVRLFSRIFLNEPWVVVQAAIPASPDVRVAHRPENGTRELLIELDITTAGGATKFVPVFLKISPSGSVTKPICPINRIGVGTAQSYSCSSNADCAAGFKCQMPCGFCDTSPFTEAPKPRVITVGEMKSLGYGVEPRTGNDRAAFRVIWEGLSRDNPLNQCPPSFDNGRTADESVVAVLNCTAHRLNGASATFDMFNGITLNSPWIVDAASVTPVDVGSASNIAPSTTPTAGSQTVFQRVRLNVARRQKAKAAISIRIKPTLPDPLPMCQLGGTDVPSVCNTDADCPRPSRSPGGGGPLHGLVLSASSTCSEVCGNRCVRP